MKLFGLLTIVCLLIFVGLVPAERTFLTEGSAQINTRQCKIREARTSQVRAALREAGQNKQRQGSSRQGAAA